jgi:hypothetical protein
MLGFEPVSRLRTPTTPRTRRACEATFLSIAAGPFACVARLDVWREGFHEPGGRFAKARWVTPGAGAIGCSRGGCDQHAHRR